MAGGRGQEGWVVLASEHLGRRDFRVGSAEHRMQKQGFKISA